MLSNAPRQVVDKDMYPRFWRLSKSCLKYSSSLFYETFYPSQTLFIALFGKSSPRIPDLVEKVIRTVPYLAYLHLNQANSYRLFSTC